VEEAVTNGSGWTERLTRLNNLLAELYPDQDAARQIVRKANLPPGAIRFHPAAGINWFNILEEAQRRNRTEAIARVAQAEFPERPEWAALADGISGRSSADSNSAMAAPALGVPHEPPVSNRSTARPAEPPSPKGKTLRPRLAVAGVSLAIVAGVIALRFLGPSSSPQRVLDARKPNVTPSQFIKPKDDASSPSTPRATLLLFVHGIFGDTVDTWSRSDRNHSLPSLLLARKEFETGYDAFVFGFPSTMLKLGSFQIPQAATAFATEIHFRQFLHKYSRIVIVAHSMGGLVALETLTTNPDIRARVPLVVSFATPYDGSQIATLGDRVLANPALSNMIPREGGNSFLSSLAYRWKRSKNTEGPITRVICAYESVPLPGIGFVVPETSASSLCDDVADPIAEDHIGIVKPDGDEHQSLKVLTNALRALPALTSAEVP
jgi:pimeloyl-ACP methyl ester carboxylesterase